MTNQRTGNASIIFHNHPLFLPTVLYVGSVPVNEYRLVSLCSHLDKDSSHAGMKAIAILIQLSKCWDFLWDFRFNDVIPRSCDQIFFSKSDILCQTCPIPQQIYIYVLIIYTKDNSFLDYAR